VLEEQYGKNRSCLKFFLVVCERKHVEFNHVRTPQFESLSPKILGKMVDHIPKKNMIEVVDFLTLCLLLQFYLIPDLFLYINIILGCSNVISKAQRTLHC
jgi:hypothetical protein